MLNALRSILVMDPTPNNPSICKEALEDFLLSKTRSFDRILARIPTRSRVPDVRVQACIRLEAWCAVR